MTRNSEPDVANEILVRVWSAGGNQGHVRVHFRDGDLETAGLAIGDVVTLNVAGAVVCGVISKDRQGLWLGIEGVEGWSHSRITEALTAVGVTHPSGHRAIVVERTAAASGSAATSPPLAGSTDESNASDARVADTIRISLKTFRKDRDEDAVHFDRIDLEHAGLSSGDEVALEVRGALIRGHVRISNGNYHLGTQKMGTDWTLRRITDDLRAVGVQRREPTLAIIVEHNGRAPSTSDPVILNARAEALLRSSGPKLQKGVIGNPHPTRVERTVSDFVRCPRVVEQVRVAAAGHCELCQEAAPFMGSNGLPFLEVHHVVTLAEGGRDEIDNAVAVCPNCHRLMHYAAPEDQKNAVDRLRATVVRLRS